MHTLAVDLLIYLFHAHILGGISELPFLLNRAVRLYEMLNYNPLYYVKERTNNH